MIPPCNTPTKWRLLYFTQWYHTVPAVSLMVEYGRYHTMVSYGGSIRWYHSVGIIKTLWGYPKFNPPGGLGPLGPNDSEQQISEVFLNAFVPERTETRREHVVDDDPIPVR